MYFRLSLAAAFLFACGPDASAQDRFATSIVSYNQGGGGGLFNTALLLGGPQGGGLGAGSLDVLTLGTGGDVVVGFDVTITDGPGADLTVFENPFVVGGSGGVFAEYAYVEVSTDGSNFARFPNAGVPASTVWGSAPGLAGGTPCLANVLLNSVDPFDPVESGGDAFDLAELTGDPLVQNGLVDLASIHYVRLVNASSTGADFDAVAVIQHTGNQILDAPVCDLWHDGAGFMHLRVADPNGLSDIDIARFRVSVNLTEVPLNRLRQLLVPLSSSPTELHLISPQPIASYGFQSLLAVSVADGSGNFSGDQITLHP